MADKAKSAKFEKAEALAEIKRLQARVEELDAYLRVHDTLKVLPATRRKGSNTAKNAIADAVADLLLDGRAMRTSLIVTVLQGNGVEIPGKIPSATVSQVLNRDSRFVASRKHGWSLVSSKVARPTFGGNTS